jgi:hypothetical protein
MGKDDTAVRKNLAGMVPVRLAVNDRADDRLAATSTPKQQTVIEVALDWQRRGTSATFAELQMYDAPAGSAYVLVGLMASAGEQLALAYAAGTEVALWQEREKGDSTEQEMCCRGMAEAQALFVTGASHALANVALRALALRGDLRSAILRKFGQTVLDDPFSNDRKGWIQFNRLSCKDLTWVAKRSGSAHIEALIAPVRSYEQSGHWRVLHERRGKDFHRWRPQSHGILGATQTTPWRQQGNQRSMGLGQPTYTEAQGLSGILATLVADTMIDLTEAMRAYSGAWPAADEALRTPRAPTSTKPSDHLRH